MQHPNYLAYLRKRFGLSQDELGGLLGDLSRSVVSRCENGDREPTLSIALGCEVIFGLTPSEIFGGLYAEIEERVMTQGALLDAKVRAKHDEASTLKRKLLTSMMERASSRVAP